MPVTRNQRLFTLVMRELQEYRVSLLWTPLIVAGLFTLLMLVAIVIGTRVAAVGDGVFEMMVTQGDSIHPAITIHLDDDEVIHVVPDAPAPPLPVDEDRELEMVAPPAPIPDDEWNFSREWHFKPDISSSSEQYQTEFSGVHRLLGLPHLVLLVVLVVVSVNYLLGSLFNDRKDRSILFWKSMPVSEWEEVLTRFAIAMLVAPAIYIGISMVLQIVLVLLGMLLAWRVGADPWGDVLNNIQFLQLFVQQVGGWILTALWIAPCYGWLLLASSWAKRTPSFVAIVPLAVVVIGELMLFGSVVVAGAVQRHLPGFVGGESQADFVFDAAYWAAFDWLGLLLGLVFAAATLAAAVWLRRYRFEI
ncbi:hypothetical protein [Haliea sp. E17]|uniref:hypothetical protein n=1 Tax=Haliea sp. E17 TaxID=3401576 RepID=UPI003AAE2963